VTAEIEYRRYLRQGDDDEGRECEAERRVGDGGHAIE
jgi:hypothetical protein